MVRSPAAATRAYLVTVDAKAGAWSAAAIVPLLLYCYVLLLLWLLG